MSETLSPARRPVRLTRRGRVVVTLAALVAIAAGFVFAHVSSLAADRHPRPAPRTITVQVGETLWQIAQRAAPQVDPRLVVAALERANHLHGPLVEPGQQLVLPVAR